MKGVSSLLCALLVLQVPSTAVAQSESYSIKRVSAYTLYESPGKYMSCGIIRADAVAISRDLFYKNGKKRCGERVEVRYRNKNGQYVTLNRVVWDTTAARYSRTVDVFMGSYTDAVNFGVKNSATLRFLK